MTHTPLKQLLDYNPETGAFTWLASSGLKTRRTQ